MSKKQNKHYVSWIFHKVRRQLPGIFLLSAMNMAVSLANILFALVTKDVVNSAVARNAEQFRTAAIIMIGLSLFRLGGSNFCHFLMVNVQERLERDFKRSVLRTILRTDYSSISKYHSGDLLQRLDSDASTVYSGVMVLFSGLAGLVISLISAVIALMQIAPIFTVACGALAVLVGSTALIFRKLLKQLSKDSSAANGRVRGYLQETLSKMMVIQALDMAPQVEKRSDMIMDERWAVRRRSRNVSMLSGLGTSSISYLSYLITMLWCGVQLMSGQITYGDVTAITSLVSTVRNSAMSIPRTLPRLFTITAACDRIMELENLPRQPDPNPEESRAIYQNMTGFRADHLTFSYDRESDVQVMKDVSLTIPKGGLTVIVGPSGIGKSTMLKLLLGLYHPNSGSLVVSTPKGDFPVDRSTRALFSYAPQGNFLLSGTLRENLTYTNPQATDAEIQNALYVSAMDEYVKSLPKGLDTVLQENGAGLSEGQAQRISLARAIISGAPVLLLDEVTSALDAVTEATVLERITALPDKTCIAVTHRPAAMELASRIITVSETGMTITER